MFGVPLREIGKLRSSLILERNLTRTSPHPEYVSPNHPVPISDSLSVGSLSEQNSEKIHFSYHFSHIC